MNKHGMQMGASGYGLTHGYSDVDDVDQDNSHEFRGHGVSESWVKCKTEAGLKKASSARIGAFQAHMKSQVKDMSPASVKAATALHAGEREMGRRMKKKGSAQARSEHSSGWDAWRAKKGK